MNYDYSKRDYLLPEGCKDLIDVLKLEAQKRVLEQKEALAPLSPLIGELIIPEQTMVLDLAASLSQEPFRIIADLIELGVLRPCIRNWTLIRL